MKVPAGSIFQADATAIPLAERAVDLTITSPPYCDARTYGINAQRGAVQWVDWMLKVLAELQRVTIGPVVIVAAGVTRDRNYWPACEGLMWEWFKLGGDCQLYRPVIWHRVGIPGSGGKDWFRADTEYCMCFKRPGKLPWHDNTACGHPPKWAPGGSMSHRLSTGARVNQWGHPIASGGTGGTIDAVTCGPARPSHFIVNDEQANQWEVGPNRRANGDYKAVRRDKIDAAATCEELIARDGQGPRAITRRKIGSSERSEGELYRPPVIANPGNLLRVKVGGGLLGHPLAHENEAPYPTDVPRFFIKSLCAPNGIVYDPFCGSGTTAQASVEEGRRYILSDLRQSQCELARRRLATPYAKRTQKPKRGIVPQASLFAPAESEVA